MLEIGSLVDGKYRIIHVIGTGGTSTVYLALNERANKQWAIKELNKTGKKADEEIRANLIAEIDTLKKLRHNHLPSIVDIIQKDGTYLIVMDYVEGRTLMRILKEEGPQPQELVVDWAIQICDVLHYLHDRPNPIIYRDMKPSNLMLRPDGNIVLIDFGTAREHKKTSGDDTRWLGTEGYAAPEQFGGMGQTDARTDIYSLGATMYQLLTGKIPKEPPYEFLPITKWNPALSKGLEKIIEKCTQPNPENRYADIPELLYDLEHYTELESGYQKKMARRFRIFAGCLICSAACFLGAVYFGHKESAVKNDTYAVHIRQAESTEDKDVAEEEYSKAIAIEPTSGEAYTDLLDNVYLADGVFSKEEADHMTEILGTVPERESMSLEERFAAADREGYADFAFRIGIAYFYYYDGSGNKPLSKPWFRIAKDAGTLDENKQLRAERFYAIASYYVDLNNKDKAGDGSASFEKYWDDLSAVSEGNIVKSDNVKTALVVYREETYQIAFHAKEFKQAGVTRKEMEDALDAVKKAMKDEVEPEIDANDEDSGQLVSEIDRNINTAENVINTTFEGTEQERQGGEET